MVQDRTIRNDLSRCYGTLNPFVFFFFFFYRDTVERFFRVRSQLFRHVLTWELVISLLKVGGIVNLRAFELINSRGSMVD